MLNGVILTSLPNKYHAEKSTPPNSINTEGRNVDDTNSTAAHCFIMKDSRDRIQECLHKTHGSR